jgi:hypothetical protein
MTFTKPYLFSIRIHGVKKYYQSMPIKVKDDLSPVPPSCHICMATLDSNLLQSFGSRRISDDGKPYYCNNPMCPPDEEQQKYRLLPFSWNNHHVARYQRQAIG